MTRIMSRNFQTSGAPMPSPVRSRRGRASSVALSVVMLAGLAACGSQPMSSGNSGVVSYPANTYPSSSYPSNTQSYVEYGRVTGLELVRGQSGGTTGAGAVIGGIAGGVVGNQVGGGTGRDLARIAGVVGGALAGNAVERNARSGTQDIYRISIQVDNGTMRTYEVPAPGDLRVGDRVRIENNQIYRL